MYWATDHTHDGGTVHPQTLTTPLAPPAPQVTTACPSPGSTAPLFPPRDADAETFHAWLARAAWPEVVFGARPPSPPPAQ